jgi:hypothetical protein
MDAGRFDALSKSLAGRRSRRSFGAAGIAAGLFAALGGESARAATSTCSLRITATTAVGPNTNTTYAGTLSMTINEQGAIDTGSFDTDDGASYPLVGQATGRALNLRITLGDGRALALAGTAELDLILCRGEVSGTFGGPGDTDVGTWRTVSAGGTPSTSSGTPGGASGSGSGGSNAGGSSSGAGVDTSDGGDSSGGAGDTTGNGCDAGQTLCNGQCVDLQSDINHCGDCGIGCAFDLTCVDGVCIDPGCGNDPETGIALTECGGICVNTATNPVYCGGCDTSCPSGAPCDDGVCGCQPDGSPCDPGHPDTCCFSHCPPSGVCGCVPAGGACDSTGQCCDQVDGGCANGFCAYINGHTCAGDSACFSGFCLNGVCNDR